MTAIENFSWVLQGGPGFGRRERQSPRNGERRGAQKHVAWSGCPGGCHPATRGSGPLAPGGAKIERYFPPRRSRARRHLTLNGVRWHTALACARRRFLYSDSWGLRSIRPQNIRPLARRCKPQSLLLRSGLAQKVPVAGSHLAIG